MNRFRLVVLGLCLVLTVGFMLTYSPAVQAAGCYIATIRGRSGVEPMSLKIKNGDCVIFMNFSGQAQGTDQVKVLYKEGKKCEAATAAAFGFGMDANKCFASGWLTYGQSANLVFVREGTYTYEVQFKGGGSPLTGEIVVQK